MTSWKRKLQLATPKNSEMHPGGLRFSPNVAVTLAVGMVDAVDPMDPVDAVDMVEAVELETDTKVSASIAKWTATLQMHAENTYALRREETTEAMSGFASSAGSQAASKMLESPINVSRSGGE